MDFEQTGVLLPLVFLSPLIANPSCFSLQDLLVSNPETPLKLHRSPNRNRFSQRLRRRFPLSRFLRIFLPKPSQLDSHPQLFALIIEHLTGNEILPFGAFSTAEIYEVRRLRSKNLRKDADYFGLEARASWRIRMVSRSRVVGMEGKHLLSISRCPEYGQCSFSKHQPLEKSFADLSSTE